MAQYSTMGKYYSAGTKGTDKPVKIPIPLGTEIKKPKKTSDSLGGLSKETEKLELAAQTPSQRKARRTRRFNMLSRKKLT